jgi:tetratricopeptide (TPR) repeat protein
MAFLRSGLAAVLLLMIAPAVHAQQSDQQRLDTCLDRIESDPEGAYEDGLAWAGAGGSASAKQCVALALIGLKRIEEGATRLEQLANDKNGGTLEARALYLTQAGNAWLLAGAPEAAVVTLTNAMKISPKDAALHVDRARAYSAMKKWTEAGRDLDAALALSPGDAEALRMRSKALYETGKLEEAWSDIAKALRADGQSVEALVLRGQIREAMRAKGMKDPEGL